MQAMKAAKKAIETGLVPIEAVGWAAMAGLQQQPSRRRECAR